MKKFFDKDNFLFPSFTKGQKRQSLVISIALIIFFVFSGYTLFNAMYAFTDGIGSVVSGSMDSCIRDLMRSIPLFLSFFMSIWALFLLQASFRNVSNEKRIKSLKKDAITLLALAGVNLIWVIAATIAGKYHSLVEGSPSPLYPLDSILYSLIYVALAIFTLVYVSKLQDKRPFLLESRGQIVTKARGLYCFFISFWMLLALFSFASFTIGLFIHDFGNGYFFYAISLILVYFINFLYFAVWEFYYNELKEEKKKEFLLPLAICSLIISIIVAVLYLVSLGFDLDAPANSGFGILPVAFAASVNLATLIIVFTPVIVSIVAFVKGLLIRKK